jgi:hypothetical protein
VLGLGASVSGDGGRATVDEHVFDADLGLLGSMHAEMDTQFATSILNDWTSYAPRSFSESGGRNLLRWLCRGRLGLFVGINSA